MSVYEAKMVKGACEITYRHQKVFVFRMISSKVVCTAKWRIWGNVNLFVPGDVYKKMCSIAKGMFVEINDSSHGTHTPCYCPPNNEYENVQRASEANEHVCPVDD